MYTDCFSTLQISPEEFVHMLENNESSGVTINLVAYNIANY